MTNQPTHYYGVLIESKCSRDGRPFVHFEDSADETFDDAIKTARSLRNCMDCELKALVKIHRVTGETTTVFKCADLIDHIDQLEADEERAESAASRYMRREIAYAQWATR